MLMRGIAWKEEVLANGDLSPAILKRLAAIAAECRERRLKSRETGKTVRAMVEPPNRLKPGARLVKIWRGETYVVDISSEGYHWNGDVYPSLSAAAKAITGTHWNGPLFFGLTKRPPYDRANPKGRKRRAAPEREAA